MNTGRPLPAPCCRSHATSLFLLHSRRSTILTFFANTLCKWAHQECNLSIVSGMLETTRAPGPLHPLPTPDKQGNSVALDFISPLPTDNGYDCVLSLMDHLGSDVRIIPTTMKATAKDTALLVFNHWYCKNGLPLNFISDRDKLFMSCFWNALFQLSGVKLKMLSGYHPQTDSSSECMNKTINQAIMFHLERNQKGWVQALPRIRFCMMNMINISMGYSGFQLRLG